METTHPSAVQREGALESAGSADSVAAYYAYSRDEMLAFMPASFSRMLEVGCGAGGFARRLNLDAEIWGVEPVAAAANSARTAMSRVLAGRYDEVADQIPDGYFDVAVCNDVIEHLPDHESFLNSLRGKLRPGGWLVGSVPNVRYYKVLYELLVNRDWRYTDDGVMDRTHLRFFTDRSFARSLRANGFEIELMTGIYSATGQLRDWRDLLKRGFFGSMSLVSAGGFSDIRFRQFAFRARRPE